MEVFLVFILLYSAVSMLFSILQLTQYIQFPLYKRISIINEEHCANSLYKPEQTVIFFKVLDAEGIDM